MKSFNLYNPQSKEFSCKSFTNRKHLESWLLDNPEWIETETIRPSPLHEYVDGIWVMDSSDKYIAEYAKVDTQREALYRKETDPLENEARRLERSGANAEQLNVYYERINELVDKIKTENPWPTPPTS
jgi:hypothetical protein